MFLSWSFLLPSPSTTPPSSTFPLTQTVTLLLSLSVSLYTLISHYQRCHVTEWVEQQRRMSLRLQRGQLNLRLLFETYTSKSLPPHTLHIALSMPLTKLYIYIAVDGGWAVFMVCLWEEKEKKLKHNVAPWWQTRLVQMLCRGFPLSACCPVLCFHYVHTVWVFSVKSTAELRKIMHNEVAFKRQSSIWRGRWSSMLVSLMSQWVTLQCIYGFKTFSPNIDLWIICFRVAQWGQHGAKFTRTGDWFTL